VIGNVILGVVDLDATSGQLRALGLDVVEGGRHPGLGTRNRIVPLGASYLELLAVEDVATAERTEFGRSLLARISGGDRLTRWSIRTDRIEEVAAALGLEVDDRARDHPDGRTLNWRSAGLAPSLADPTRPFFMQWPDADWPGNEAASHDARLVGLELSVPDRAELERWTLGTSLPLRVQDGPADLRSVAIEAAGTELVLPPT
jgi:Glyoxalase-like domain